MENMSCLLRCTCIPVGLLFAPQATPVGQHPKKLNRPKPIMACGSTWMRHTEMNNTSNHALMRKDLALCPTICCEFSSSSELSIANNCFVILLHVHSWLLETLKHGNVTYLYEHVKFNSPDRHKKWQFQTVKSKKFSLSWELRPHSVTKLCTTT